MNDEIKRYIDNQIKKALEEQGVRAIHTSQILPKMVKQSHIEDVVIKFGLDADRPTDGGDANIKAYFGTDNDTLACWNGTAWVEEVLT